MITESLLDTGDLESFAYLHLGFSGYLRPSENSGLLLEHIIPPVGPENPSLDHWTVFLCPSRAAP